MEMIRNERRIVHFSGHVQGVGFRYYVNQIAGRFAVSGFVRNLSDGRVHLVTEGTAAELDAFVAEIRKEMASNIDDIDSEISVATGEFETFSIRY